MRTPANMVSATPIRLFWTPSPQNESSGTLAKPGRAHNNAKVLSHREFARYAWRESTHCGLVLKLYRSVLVMSGPRVNA